jgi:hypothetical protein
MANKLRVKFDKLDIDSLGEYKISLKFYVILSYIQYNDFSDCPEDFCKALEKFKEYIDKLSTSFEENIDIHDFNFDDLIENSKYDKEKNEIMKNCWKKLIED